MDGVDFQHRSADFDAIVEQVAAALSPARS